MTTITIVTPWYGHRELERDYWNAVRGCEVIVVDNGSEPPLPNAWRLSENEGFSRACNIGLDLARTDAVLFLNNDIVMTRSDWLEPIREALEPGVLVGAEMRYDRHADVDGHAYPFLNGWCLAGMREDLLDLGGFDEGYAEPAYFSDNDLCFRARLEGMKLRPVKVGLIHIGNRTAGTAFDPVTRAVSEANQQRYMTRAREALVAA